MAEATSTKKSEPTRLPDEKKGALAKSESDGLEAPKAESRLAAGPPLVMRALIGFSGLSLLVGYFLPWLNVTEGETSVTRSGLDLTFAGELVGSPSMLLLLVPILGVLLSAASFMGFRFTAQAAVGVAVALVGYSLYVLLQMFVQHTAMGLWVVSGGTFITLLLGVITWMLMRRSGDGSAKESSADKTDVDAPSTSKA